MFTELHWIDGPWPGRLAIAPRPRGDDWLDDEMKAWRRNGIDIVVSLLMPDEAEQLGLENEGRSCAAAGMEYSALPILDRSVPPSMKDVADLLTHLEAHLSRGKNIVVHCRQGLGRAGLIASALEIDAGLSPSDAIRRVSAARGAPVPETPEQRAWIESFAAAPPHRR
jgi:protein-tyrosine phosphatase